MSVSYEKQYCFHNILSTMWRSISLPNVATYEYRHKLCSNSGDSVKIPNIWWPLEWVVVCKPYLRCNKDVILMALIQQKFKTLATSPVQPQGPIILHSQSLMTLKIKINLKIWMLGSFLQSKRISPIFESPHWSWPVMKFTWPDLTFLKNVWLTSCDAGRSAGGSRIDWIAKLFRALRG